MILSICIGSLFLLLCDMYLLCEADTERAVGLLRQYQANLTSPEEQTLRTSVGKVSAILGSQLFQALLGKENTVKVLPLAKGSFSKLRLHHSFLSMEFLFSFKLPSF